MKIKAKFTAIGITKGKQYNVIGEKKAINSYEIILDDGTIGVRHKCGFEVIKE